MKKYWKQLKSIVLAVVLVFGMTALAALPGAENISAADPTTSIRITGIEKEANMAVYAYAIALDAVDEKGNHYWKYGNDTAKGYIEDGNLSTMDLIYFYTNLNDNSGVSADNEWNLHNGRGEAVVDETVLELAYQPDGAFKTTEPVQPGLYVIAVNRPAGTGSYSFTVVAVNYKYDGEGVASIADENGVVNAAVKRSDSPTLKKEVADGKKYSDGAIGDVVQFQLTLTIPDYANAWSSDLHYRIKDDLSRGLTLNQSSIRLEGTLVNDLFDAAHRKNPNTTVITSEAGFTLDLYGQDIFGYKGQTVTIVYEATINAQARVNFVGATNTASLQYTTTPGNTDLSTPVSDKTYHYTFGLDTLVNGAGSDTTTEITKYGVRTTTQTDNKVPLEGAQFQIFKGSTATGQPLWFNADGQLAKATDGNVYNYVTTGEDGSLVITGLDAGTYAIKESKAPYGYALDPVTYTATITPTYRITGELQKYEVKISNGAGNTITFTHEKMDSGAVQSTDNAAEANSFAIINTPLLTLPATGGLGVIAVTVAAVVLMVIFGSTFILLHKKGKSNR